MRLLLFVISSLSIANGARILVQSLHNQDETRLGSLQSAHLADVGVPIGRATVFF